MEAPPEHKALFAAIKNNDHEGVRALVRAHPTILRDASKAAGTTKAVGYAVTKIVWNEGSCEQSRACRVMMIRLVLCARGVLVECSLYCAPPLAARLQLWRWCPRCVMPARM